MRTLVTAMKSLGLLASLLAFATFCAHVQAADSATCPATIQTSMDYGSGSPSERKFVNVSSIDECCSACAGYNLCKAFSYCTVWPCPRGHGGGRPNCHLKSAAPSANQTATCAGMSSGIMSNKAGVLFHVSVERQRHVVVTFLLHGHKHAWRTRMRTYTLVQTHTHTTRTAVI